jgi:hypothetical protein
LKHCGFCHICWEVVDTLSNCCCCGGGCGCNSEVYWSEWHNDPPRCCDPCDCYGNWTGPGNGPYRAPYAHAYAPHGYTGGAAYVAKDSSPAHYANKHASRASYAKNNMKSQSQRQHVVAKQTQPARAKQKVAYNRGAAAVVIRR